MSTLELHLLGKPEVTQEGESVGGFRSNKVRALLFYVAVRGRPEARAKLAGLFWGDLPEENANANLRKSLTNLRRIAPSHLVITRDSVAIAEQNPPWVDVRAFEAAVDEDDPSRLEQAVHLYRGDFLEGFYLRQAASFEAWQFAERRRLRERLLQALQHLAGFEADHGHHDSATRHLQRLLTLEPLREDMQRLLIRLYWQNGQQARALKQYEAYRELLEKELGVAPAPETRTLVKHIRAGAPTQRASRVAGGPISTVAPLRPGFLEDSGEAGQTSRRLFIGRDAQLAQLSKHLVAAIEGELRVAFVTGEAGYGKSALLHEFARRALASHPDLIVAAGRCNAFSGRGDPFHPFREILNLLAGDVESQWRAGAVTKEQAERLWSLTPTTAAALAREGAGLLQQFFSGSALLERAAAWTTGEEKWWHRLREIVAAQDPAPVERVQLLSQFAAVLRQVTQQQPLLLLLDDLQWADNSSLDLLFHLSRDLPHQPLFILGAYRASEAALARDEQGQPLLPLLLTELERRFGQANIDLGSLSEQAARNFLSDLIDSEPNRLSQPFRNTLFERTQGHPLYSIELLREMQVRGDLRQNQDRLWEATDTLRWDRLPPRVEAIISQRLGRLAPELYDILAVASVEGQSFTAQVVARVMAQEERYLLHQLGHLQREHRLVRELSEVKLGQGWLTSFRFNHILFQQQLYQNLSHGERRLLHGEVAAALENLNSEHLETASVALAHHYTQAGDTEKAIFYLLAAGDRARSQNAYREALEHYGRALRILKEKGDHRGAARTLMKIGLTHHNASAFEEARRANEEAFRLWQQLRPAKGSALLPPAPHPLRVAGEIFSGDFDPAMVKETPRALLVQQLFSGLMRLGHDMELLPDVAQGWDVVDDGKRYIFHLRRNVRWSDGHPVTANDFEYGWKRVLHQTTGSPSAIDLFDVKGARAFHLGQAGAHEVGIMALDDFTLQVELVRPSPYFPNMLFVESTKPVPRHTMEKYGADWTRPDNLVTNGPFRLVSLQPREKVVLARYPDYHGSFSGNVQQVEVHLGLGADRLRHLEMYLADRLDVLYTFSHLPPDTQKRLREELIDEYRTGPVLATWLIGFVLSRPPVDDRRVRQALVMATDRQYLANIVNRGLVAPATGGFLSPAHAAYTEGIGLPFDPAAARQLLAEAGYPGGRGLPVLTMVSGHASLSVEANLRYLQSQWRHELGVDLRWETIWEMGPFLRRLRDDPPHFFFIRWAGKHTDPDDFLHRESALVWEIARWHDEDYFDLLQRARRLTDWSQRIAFYRQADRQLIDQAVVLPVAYDRSHLLVKPWVRRLVIPTIPRWYFSEVYLMRH